MNLRPLLHDRPHSFTAGPGPLQLGAQPHADRMAAGVGRSQPGTVEDHGSLWQTPPPAPPSTDLTVRKLSV